ncbi:MAG: cation-transporting P-type ATPase [Clostridia bacterium]|nr:cation-transporting P-type ATPase [Clostridia bacterium]
MNILNKPLDELKRILGTDFSKGLSQDRVKKNAEAFGLNIPFDDQENKLSLFFKNLFSDVMPWLFIGLCLISLFLERKSFMLPAFVLFLVYVSVRLATFMIIKNIDDDIKVYRKITSVVIRHGKTHRINAKQLVPGDIMILKKGDFVPCDCIVIDALAFSVYEAYITSNPNTTPKKSQTMIAPDGEPYHNCLVFAGSVVCEGEAKVLVCHTGKNIFKINTTPIKKVFYNQMPKIYRNNLFVGKQLYLLWILMCFIIFTIGVLLKFDVFSMIFMAATLSIAALGDCIPLFSEFGMLFQISRLYKKYDCVLKNYQTIDTFNANDTVFIENFNYFLNSIPEVKSFYINNSFYSPDNIKSETRNELIKYAMASAMQQPKSRQYIHISLSNYAESLGITPKSIENEFIYISKYSADFEGVLTFRAGEYAVITRGLASSLLKKCTSVKVNNSIREIGRKERFALRDNIREMERNSQTVLAVAKQAVSFSSETNECVVHSDKLTLLGFIGFYNPINTDAIKALSMCKKNGINVALTENEASGTHANMAKSISLTSSDDLSLNSEQLSKIDEGLLRADLKRYKVFSGLTQQQRLYIAKLYKENGNVLTCIPNSLEDIPLQAVSDASITAYNEELPAANYFSDAIFLKRDFSIFTALVKHSRAVYHNASRMLLYILTNQFFMCTHILTGMIFEKKLIFSPAVLLLYGIFAVFPAAFAISCEVPPDNKPLSEPNYNKYIFRLFSLIPHPFIIGLSGGITSVLVYRIYNSDHEIASAASLITLFTSAYLSAISLRNDELFIHKKITPLFMLIPLLSFAVLTIIFSMPFLSRALEVSLPNFEVALISMIFSVIPFSISEILKRAKNLTK